MKIRVAYTVEVDEFYRLALSHRHGRTHKATRQELHDHFHVFGMTLDDTMPQDYQEYLDAQQKEKP